MDQLLTVNEVCARLNVRRSWVYKKGVVLIPFTRLGVDGSIRFRECDVETFIEHNMNYPEDVTRMVDQMLHE